jgi:hypothetical protein
MSFASGNNTKIDSKCRIGTINMAVATSLHPKMSLFDFQMLSFFRISMGLPPEEYKDRIKRLKNSDPSRQLQEQMKEVKKLIKAKEKKIREIISSERTHNPDKMASDAAKVFNQNYEQLTELNIKRREIRFQLNHPEYTSPSETREILKEIEQDLLQSIKEVSKEQEFDVVLNTSVPVSFGYPVNYHSNSRRVTGPIGIDQTLIYAFLAEKRVDYKSITDTEDYIREWISITGRPEAIERIPLQPHPLVLEGGESILTLVLEKLYDKYQVKQEIFDQLKEILQKLELK